MFHASRDHETPSKIFAFYKGALALLNSDHRRTLRSINLIRVKGISIFAKKQKELAI